MSPMTARMAKMAGGLLATVSGPFIFQAAGMPAHVANHAAYFVMIVLYCLGGWTVAELLVKWVTRLGAGRSES